jgi:hypothetical protein
MVLKSVNRARSTNSLEEYVLYGVTEDDDMTPAWSTKCGIGWNTCGDLDHILEEASEEEMAFLEQYNTFAEEIGEPAIGF